MFIYRLIKKVNSFPLLILLSVVLCVHLAWIALVPFAGFPYGAPDEIHHFEVTRFVAETGRMPVFGPDKDLYIRVPPGFEESVDTRIYGWHALFPSGAYILPGLFMHLLPPLTFQQQVFVARLFSAFWNLCLVYFTYKITIYLFPGDRLFAFGVSVFVSMIPQVVFVGSYHNSDALTLAATAASMFFGLKFLDGGYAKWVTNLELGLALGFVAMAKQHGWLVNFLFVSSILLLAGRKIIASRKLLPLFGFVIPPMLVFGSWFLSQQLNYGDILARDVFGSAWTNDRPYLVSFVEQGYSVLDFFLKTNWLPMTFKSFWGVFGYMSVRMSLAIYWVLFSWCLLSSIGLSKGIFSRFRDGNIDFKSWRNWVLCVFGGIIVALVAAAVYTSYYNDYQPQGRYLFPALVPIAIFLLWGWRELLSPKWRSLGFKLLCVGMLFFNLFSLIVYVIPGMTMPVDVQWFF